MLPPNALSDDIEALKPALVVGRAEAAAARPQLTADQALIAHLKLQIEKLNRERFGQRSERTARLIDQLELQLEELEASATEDELAAERADHRAGADRLPVLRQRAFAQAGRGCHRDAGGDPSAVEGDPTCPREV